MPPWPALALSLLTAACGLLEPNGEAPQPDSIEGLTCRTVAVPAGPEDLVVDDRHGIAWIASTDRRTLAYGEDDRQVGFLSRLDLRQERPQAVDVTPAALRNPSFRPHGLGLLPAQPPRLFVVDRRPPAAGEPSCAVDNAIRVLEVEGDRLRLVATVEDPLSLVRLNDVEPLDATRFFATSDHAPGSCLARNLRDLFGRNGGHLLAFDGARFEVAAEGLPFANGLAFDRARRTLYAAASGDGTIRRFDVGDSPRELAPRPPIRLDRSPDNLSLDADGQLLAAAHPDRIRFMLVQRQWLGVDQAPSSILAIAPQGSAPEVREILSDDGTVFSAASVAARFVWPERQLERLLLGQVFGDQLLLCERPLPTPEGGGGPRSTRDR